MTSIIHFGASNYPLAFLAHKRTSPANAAISTAVGLCTGGQIDAVLIMFTIVISIYNQLLSVTKTFPKMNNNISRADIYLYAQSQE